MITGNVKCYVAKFVCRDYDRDWQQLIHCLQQLVNQLRINNKFFYVIQQLLLLGFLTIRKVLKFTNVSFELTAVITL